MTMTNEERRRASGAAMTARRTGKSVADDIQSLVQPPRQAKPLPRIDPVGPLAPQRGRGDYKAPARSVTAGIASPLVEPDAGNREYYPTVLLPTTDGLAWARLRSVRRYVMEDANGDEVIQEFANGFT